MKREKLTTLFVAAGIASLTAFGAVGGMMSGFDLSVDSMPRFALITLMVSLLTACGFSVKRGGWWVLGGAVAAAVLLAVFTDTVSECAQLLYRISYEYDTIYGWGYFTFGQTLQFYVSFDRAAAVFAAVIAIAVTGTMCRRKKAFLAVGVSLIPLIACLVMTHTVPKQGYLLCLLAGVTLLVLTNTLRRQNEGDANKLTALAAIPVAVLLFFLLYACSPAEYVNKPDEWRDRVLSWFDFAGVDGPAGADGEEGNGGEAVSSGVKVDLSRIGPRITDHVGVADIVCTEDGTLYLREQHYDTYTGMNWTIDAHDVQSITSPADGEQTLSIATHRLREKLLMPYYPSLNSNLFATDTPWLFAGSLNNARERAEYTWDYTPLGDDWREPLEHQIGKVQGTDNAPRMPDDTIAWALPLAEEILNGDESTVTEIAEKIAAYVKAHGEYDLNTAAMPDTETDFARWFLTESDSGYCVHYATATAVLLRAVGIDARYVTGYACVVENGKTMLYADQAHAWVEYYETLLGMWIPLECTPSDPETGAPVFAPETTNTTGGAKVTTLPTSSVPTTSATKPPSGSAPVDKPQPKREIPAVVWVTAGAVIGTAVFLVTAMLLQRRVRLERRRRRLQRRVPNKRALGIWQEIERCARFTDVPPDEAVYALAQKAKFSQHTLTADELDVLAAGLQTQIEILRSRSRAKRWWYRFVWVLY